MKTNGVLTQIHSKNAMSTVENETEVENLENKIAQKDREIFKKQLQIDLAKLQLQ